MCSTQLSIVCLLLFLNGCFATESLHQSSSADLSILLRDHHASIIPGHKEVIFFIDQPLDDHALAAATPYIRAYRPTELYLDSSRLTDNSLPQFAQFETVRTLDLGRCGFSIEKLAELKAMPSLNTLCIDYRAAPWKEAVRVMQPEIFVDGWEYARPSGLSNRASMFAATKVALREFGYDAAQFIRGFTMPP